ncbi:MAG TPA: hypothetical protein VLG67_00975 [Candidatus Saccharimonadales bacterium]|nr:hypothetical protein [Candidatus Saccharimonadales bacterium]
MKGFERLRQHVPWNRERTQEVNLRTLINDSFYTYSPKISKGFNPVLETEEEVINFSNRKRPLINRLVFRSNYDIYNPGVATIRIHWINPGSNEATVIYLNPNGEDVKQTIIRQGTDFESTITNPLLDAEKCQLFKDLSESEVRKVIVIN